MFYLRKSSGERQRFDLQKFRRSLLKAGAREKDINTIIQHIQKEKPPSTQRIHEITTELLRQKDPAVADRYNLKRGLMELGPEGYPFEKFVAYIIREMGYDTEINRIIPGLCVDHEVDILARKEGHRCMVECKFHNRIGMKSDVKITLYVQARFEDIRDAWEQKQNYRDEIHAVWLVTNTQFTTEAIKYGECKRFKLIGWGYPKEKSLAQLIETYSLFPITTLTSLSKRQKRMFLKHGIILCREARSHQKKLEQLGLNPQEIQKLISEAEAVCNLPSQPGLQ